MEQEVNDVDGSTDLPNMWINVPRLLSDVVEGFGGNLPLLILPYVLDWIVGKEAAEELVPGVERQGIQGG